MSRAITVLEPGPLALVQDLGRPGYAHLGVPPSGALDIPALTLANRLVGNPESAAGIETMGNLVLRAESSCTIAITGPPLLKSTVDTHQPVYLAPGQERLGLAGEDRVEHLVEGERVVGRAGHVGHLAPARLRRRHLEQESAHPRAHVRREDR